MNDMQDRPTLRRQESLPHAVSLAPGVVPMKRATSSSDCSGSLARLISALVGPSPPPTKQQGSTLQRNEEEAGRVVSQRYQSFVVTQILLSNMVPLVHFLRFVGSPTRAGLWSIATCCLLFVSSAVACLFKYRLSHSDAAEGGLLLALLLRLEFFQMCVLSLALLNEAVSFSASNCPPGDPSPLACAVTYFFSAHLTLVLKWVVSQLPVSLLILPEAARNACVALATLFYVHTGQEGGLTGAVALRVLAYAAGVTLLTPFLCALCHSRAFTASQLPADLSAPPGAARRAAERLERFCVRAALAILPEEVLSAQALTGVSMGVLGSIFINGSFGRGIMDVCRRVNVVIIITIVVTALSKVQAGTSTSLGMLERRLGRSRLSGAGASLEVRLAAAVSELDVLRVVAEALHALFPAARAQAVVSLADDKLQPAYIEAAALEERERVALQLALRHSDAATSAAFVCGAGGVAVADSRDWHAGVHAFSDWSAAVAVGCAAQQMVTARLTSGAHPAGYLVLAFASSTGFPSDDAKAHDALRSLCESAGAALLRRRAADAASTSARRLAHVERLAADIFPAHLLEAVSNRMVGAGSGAGGEAKPLMERHACVTVIFADVVGWTQLAAGMTPEAAMTLLDRLWQRFDTLCSAHGVYKVETIGDSYLAVCGMHPPRKDHARAALRFALDLHAAAQGVTVGRGDGDGGVGGSRSFAIRVGVHSGPVSSGVVGHLRQRWCIFGDTVNTASRMETSGRPGAVQMSDFTLILSGLDMFQVPSRHVDIKGKGPMNTYVLEAGSQDAAAARAVLDRPPGGEDDDDEQPGNVSAMRRSIDTQGSEGWSDMALEALSEEEEGNRVSVLADDGGAAAGGLGRSSQRLTLPGGAGGSGSGTDSTSGGARGEPPSTPGGEGCEEAWGGGEVAHSRCIAALLLGATGPLGFCTFWLLGLCGARGCRAAGAVLGTSYAALVPLAVAARWGAAPLAREMLAHPRALQLGVALCVVSDIVGHALAMQAWCTRVAPGPRGHIAFFWDFHAIMGATAPLTAMLPLRLALLPELLRALGFVAAALTLQWQYVGSAAGVARILCLAGGSLAATPLALILALNVPESSCAALACCETCPAPLRPARDRVVAAYSDLRDRLLGAGQPALLDSVGLATFGLRVFSVLFTLLRSEDGKATEAMVRGARDLNATLVLVLLASAAARAVSSAGGGAAADSAAAARAAGVLSDLRKRLAAARGESASLAAGCAALSELFPDAVAVAAGAFAEGAACEVLSGLEVSAAEPAARTALSAALPPDVGAPPQPGGPPASSVTRACRGRAGAIGAVVLDSRGMVGGLSECSDWAAALGGGLSAARALTVPLTAGPVTVGFAQVYFSLFHSGGGGRIDDGAAAAKLHEAAGVIGGALFVRRAFAINRDGLRPPAPLRRPSSLGLRSSAEGEAGEPSTPGAFPASDADCASLAILDSRRSADTATLDSWNLDAWALAEEEVQRLFSSMLHSMGLFRRFRISPTAFADFVSDTATHYSDNPFHCFRHAFMVTHAAWLFLREEQVRRLLDDIDCLALLLAAVVHDVEHPGTTNAFQVNSGSALALRYNDASVLESHHCAAGYAALLRCRVLAGLQPEELRVLRRTFVAAIMATDMSVHKQLLQRVSGAAARSALDGEEARAGAGAEARQLSAAPLSLRRTSMDAQRSTVRSAEHGGGFARRSAEDRQLFVSFLLHCADLSNPLLPPSLSRRVAADLSREFEAQAATERAAGLPVTVMMADDTQARAKLELGFIEYIVWPLYVTLSSVVPQLGERCLKLIGANKVMWSQACASIAEEGGQSG